MNKVVTIYHGSQNIVECPAYGCGKVNNDYGQGFYCTEHIELATEWAVSQNRDGFVNKYEIDLYKFRILELNSSKYTILNWIAILLEHRIFALDTPLARRARRYLIDNFSVNVSAYDIIIGYRADDSYYDFAEAFISNSITVDQLSQAMRLGKLGEQIVIKSKYAFAELKFLGYEMAKHEDYYMARRLRNETANKTYERLLESYEDGLFLQDIIRENIVDGDERIPRI